MGVHEHKSSHIFIQDTLSRPFLQNHIVSYENNPNGIQNRGLVVVTIKGEINRKV